MTRRAEWKVAKFEMGRLRHQKTIRDVFIFGDPGTGKTTLVKDIMWATWLDVGEGSRVIDEVPRDATTARADMCSWLERDAAERSTSEARPRLRRSVDGESHVPRESLEVSGDAP